MIGAHVGDHRRVRRVDRQPSAQDAAARGLQDGERDLRMRAAPPARPQAPNNRRAPRAGLRRTLPRWSSSPGTAPAAAAIAASKRTVVVLPLLPVTSTVGTSCSALQGSASTAGNAARGQVRLPVPAPMEISSSSSSSGSPCRTAAARRSAKRLESLGGGARGEHRRGIVAEIVRAIETPADRRPPPRPLPTPIRTAPWPSIARPAARETPETCPSPARSITRRGIRPSERARQAPHALGPALERPRLAGAPRRAG